MGHRCWNKRGKVQWLANISNTSTTTGQTQWILKWNWKGWIIGKVKGGCHQLFGVCISMSTF